MALCTAAIIHIKSKHTHSATNFQLFTALCRPAGITGRRYAVTRLFSLRTFFRRVYLYVCGYKDTAPNPKDAWTSGRKIGKKIFTDLKQIRPARPGGG